MKHRFDIRAGFITTLAAATILLMGLGACGAKVVRGESPFVKINSLKLDRNTAHIDLGIRNINDVPLEIDAMDFVLTVQGEALVAFNAPRPASVIANGSETLRFELPVNPDGAGLLTRLQGGDIESLPYLLEGSIRTVGEKKLDLEGQGHIYPVPGRPGQFR